MEERKVEDQHDTNKYGTGKIERLNSLVEGNDYAKWIQSNLMKRMDKFAYFRSLILLCFFGFFLGNNLGIFLWLHIAVTIYLIVYRVARFWVKRWLMLLIEFCYFGNTLLICFILFYGESLKVFYTIYIPATGVMSIAVIIFNNQAHFNSTDHLTSSYIHTFPLLTVWAIRWRHKLYAVDASSDYFSLLRFDEVPSTPGAPGAEPINFYILQIYPLLFWIFWASTYLILCSTVLSYYVINPKYGSGIRDFLELGQKMKFLFGDLQKNSLLKYVLQHFLMFILSMPLCWLCYNNFWVNSIYVVMILVYLAWNTGRNNMRNLEKKLIKHELKNKLEENNNI